MINSIDCFSSEFLAGRQVFITGGTRGIGLGIATGFAKLGASVLATGRSAEGVKGGDGKIRFAQLDVRDKTAIDACISSLPRLDVLVNCAGIAQPQDEFKEDVYLDVMNVNLNSAMWTSMAARSRLAATRGCIVNIASMLSFLADSAVPAYCASKTGILGLTRSLAFAFGGEGIRVNAIAPGYHKTEMTKVHWEQPEAERRIGARSALGRWGTVDDLVGAVVFLASPAACFITGTTLAVDGGFSIG